MATYTTASPAPGDLGKIRALVSAASSDLEVTVAGPDGNGQAGFQLLAKDEANGEIVGYLDLRETSHDWTMDYFTAPDADRSTVASEMLKAALSFLSDRGAVAKLWITAPSDQDDATVTSAGLEQERELLVMYRPLTADDIDESLPGDGLRNFVVGRDEAAFLTLNNAAFAGHPEQGNWDLAELEEHERATWFDPKGFFLAKQDAMLLGFCWTKRHSDPPRGEIYVIGVHPAFQGRHLGAQLLSCGFSYLASRGERTVELYVDSANHGAVVFYEHRGFSTHHVHRAYRTPSVVSRGPRRS